jgi:hypothetical protein
MIKGAFIRRYVGSLNEVHHGFELSFTPLLQTATRTASKKNMITFSGETREICEQKAFAAGFRDAEMESSHAPIPDRWDKRWTQEE